MKKLHSVDCMSVVLSLMVVFIHVSSEIIGTYPKTEWLYPYVFVIWKFCSYAVPAFIFLSGFKLFLNGNAMNAEYGPYIRKRFKAILLPYTVAFLVYYLYFIKYGYYSFDGFAMIKMFLLGNLVSHFYFITIIMQFYLLFPIWKKYLKLSPMIGSVTALILTLLFKAYMVEWNFIYIDRVFTTYLIYWILGCYLGIYKSKNNEKSMPWLSAMIPVFVGIAFFHIIRSMNQSIYKVFYPHAELWHMLFCVFGAFGTFSLSSWLVNQFKWVKWISQYFGSLTFTVYLWHVLLIYMVNDLLNRYALTLGVRFGIRSIVTYIGSFFIAWFIQKGVFILKNKVGVIWKN